MNFIALLLFLPLAMALPRKTEPYRIVLISDAESANRAHEYVAYLKKKSPFSKMSPQDLEIKVVTHPKEEMKCTIPNPKAPRAIGCDSKKLNEIKAREEAHLAVAFTSAVKGGSGGDIPIASKDFPLATALHEMLHTYGLRDEYAYSQEEAEIYCNPLRYGSNQAYFQEDPPYSDEGLARSRHRDNVPWMGQIPVDNFIVNESKLGSKTPEKIVPGRQIMGLYRGGSCDNRVVIFQETRITSWRPYPNSLMRGFEDDTIYPIYEQTIIKSIESKIGRSLGIRLHMKGLNFDYDDCPVPFPILEDQPVFEELMRKTEV